MFNPPQIIRKQTKEEEEMSSCLAEIRNVFHLVNNTNFAAGDSNETMDFFSLEN